MRTDFHYLNLLQLGSPWDNGWFNSSLSPSSSPPYRGADINFSTEGRGTDLVPPARDPAPADLPMPWWRLEPSTLLIICTSFHIVHTYAATWAWSSSYSTYVHAVVPVYVHQYTIHIYINGVRIYILLSLGNMLINSLKGFFRALKKYRVGGFPSQLFYANGFSAQ